MVGHHNADWVGIPPPVTVTICNNVSTLSYASYFDDNMDNIVPNADICYNGDVEYSDELLLMVISYDKLEIAYCTEDE